MEVPLHIEAYLTDNDDELELRIIVPAKYRYDDAYWIKIYEMSRRVAEQRHIRHYCVDTNELMRYAGGLRSRYRGGLVRQLTGKVSRWIVGWHWWNPFLHNAGN